MARIRTIKPEFFTSADIVSLTPLSRLFYIALWCEADREGRLNWNTKTLKMRYMPADNCDIEAMADELVKANLIAIYTVDGRKYAEIMSFKNHQVINNRESESIIPSRVKVASPREQGEGRKEGKGKEGKEGDVPTNVGDQCPHQEIIALYHEHLPMMTRIVSWTPTRADSLRARWRESKTHQTLDFWERMFKYVAKSDFLTGKDGKWQADLEWMLKESNFVKILEGKYTNKGESNEH